MCIYLRDCNRSVVGWLNDKYCYPEAIRIFNYEASFIDIKTNDYGYYFFNPSKLNLKINFGEWIIGRS